MYKWKIDIILKSGKELTVYHQGDQNNSHAVATALLTGRENTLNGFSNKNGTENIFINISEIACASISAA